MLPPQDNLFLIGYRGTGKSTVGRRVAEQLGRPFFDSDVEIEHRQGRSIAEIFAGEGELRFRELEAAVLDELSRGSGSVLALGGGIVMRPGNRAKLKTRGRTAWLVARPATLWQRIVDDQATGHRRPNLTAAGGLAEVVEVLARRLPVYRECADWVVDTEGKTADDVAGEIVALVRGAAGAQP
ncbi:MAG TPA: shikimate kinase [Pirellulales bacterium]|jgi:shikimate kinase|nr:shikimate kinase [Pirellulales bacterium]